MGNEKDNLLIGIMVVKDKSLFGRLISLFEWSKENHGAFINLNANDIYEQTVKGLRTTYKKAYALDYEIIKEVEVNRDVFFANIEKYKDTKYDWFATLLFPINKIFGTKFGKSKKRLMCVEAIGAILEIDELNYKVSPKNMRKVLK